MNAPTVILSTTTSIDGYLDDSSDHRLILSSEEDRYEVHRLRSQVDAILIGAETLRKDNPFLNIRYPDLQTGRSPIKVVVTNSGELDPIANFFCEGDCKKIVFCGPSTPPAKLAILSEVAVVVPAVTNITATSILQHLLSIGVTSLLVEGGAKIQNMFFFEHCVDILRFGVAPLILGNFGSTRFLLGCNVSSSKFTVLSNQMLGSTIVTWYEVKQDHQWWPQLHATPRLT